MKKSKLLVSLLATSMMVGMSACDDDLENENQDIVAVYRSYQANAEANGEEPLSYQDWLASIKGAKGDKGDKGDDGKDGKDGVSPVVTIGDNGNWFINGVDSGKSAKGDKGEKGNDGTTPNAPVVAINADNHWTIDGVDTGVVVVGPKGDKGADGATPVIDINIDKHWTIDGRDTGIKAVGENGKDAIAPVITINDDGYWCVNGTSLGVKAKGEKGDKGDQGDVGATGKSAYEIWKEYHPHYTGDEEQWSDDLGNGALAGFLKGHGDNAINVHAVEDDDTVTMVAECAVCGEEFTYKTMDKVLPATFHVDLEARSGSTYKFSYDETTGVYTSTNKGANSSSCYLDIVIDTAGVIEFDYTSSGEGGFDYLYFGDSSTSESSAYVSCKGSGSAAHNVSSSYSREVAAGEVLTFVYKKDSSGNAGDDQATVKFTTSEITYGVLEFDTNGGSKVNPMFLKNGKPVETIEEPTCSLKYFEGWYVDEDLNTPYVASEAFEGNGKLYAKWSDGQFVTFNENGGNPIDAVMFRAGTTPEMPADPTRDGFIFLGWYTDPDLADEHKYVPGNANAGFSLYAKWFDMSLAHAMYGHYSGVKQYGNNSPSTSYAEMDVDVVGNYSVREYYSGYLTGTLGALNVSGVTSSDNNGTVIYDDYRGIAVFVKDVDITADTYVFVMNKDGNLTSSNVKYKSFKLGSDTKTGGLRLLTIINGTDKVNIVVDASNDKVIYNANVKDINNNPIYADTIENNELVLNVMEPGTFATTKYGLSGSNTYAKLADDAFTGVFNNTEKGEIKFSGAGKAIWNGMSNNSVFDYEKVDDDIYYLSYSATYRYLVVVDPVSGTYDYSVRTVNATFNPNYEGSTNATYAFKYDYWTDFEDVPVANPTREGYAFNGWYTDAVNGSEKTRDSITAETTYYAHWLKKITISFLDDDGSEIEELNRINAVEGSAIGTLPVPTKAGKMFMGWFTDNVNYTTEVTAATVAAAADMQLYAKWADPVTLFVDAGNALLDFAVEVKPGTVPVFDTPYREGHAVAGYYADDTFSTPYDITQPINADTTIYVQWINGVPAYGTYKGYNLWSSGTESKKFSDFGFDLSVAADGTVTGKHTLTLSSGVNANIGDENRYMYFSQELGILWTAYGSSSTDVGTDTNIFFDTNRNIKKVDFFRLGSLNGSYAFVGQITYNDGSTRLFAGYNNVIYADVTIEGKTFAELTGTSVTGYTVKDSADNVIFSK